MSWDSSQMPFAQALSVLLALGQNVCCANCSRGWPLEASSGLSSLSWLNFCFKTAVWRHMSTRQDRLRLCSSLYSAPWNSFQDRLVLARFVFSELKLLSQERWPDLPELQLFRFNPCSFAAGGFVGWTLTILAVAFQLSQDPTCREILSVCCNDILKP